jgi:hypothetical protein
MAKFVCLKCFADTALQDFVEGEAVEHECDFCGEKANHPIAAPISEVGRHMNDCIQEEYDDAANCLSYVSAEGGWLGKTWDTWDLLADKIGLDLPRDTSGTLFDAIRNELGDYAWCEKNPYSLNYEQSGRYSWERFCRVVKHERRFFFSEHGSYSKDDEVLSPSVTLHQIFDYAEKVGLFVPLPSQTMLFRARYQPSGKEYTTVEDLGPPTADKAIQSNRMSPPGIVMFYASDDPTTALRETALKVGTYVVARFETRRNAIILDLSKLPPIPSLFEAVPDSLEYHPRRVLTFLHRIAEAISQPIARDDRVHVSYVPTQIVTEYIRSRHLYDEKPIDGVRFSSAVHEDHASYVLFATQENMLGTRLRALSEPTDPWIALVSSSPYTVDESHLTQWRSEDSGVNWASIED